MSEINYTDPLTKLEDKEGKKQDKDLVWHLPLIYNWMAFDLLQIKALQKNLKRLKLNKCTLRVRTCSTWHAHYMTQWQCLQKSEPTKNEDKRVARVYHASAKKQCPE